jgi:hypothetical protein
MSDPTYAELEIGEQGEHVSELQERLRDLGHDVPDSGVFDEQTQTVLIEFATSHGVTDGTSASAVAQLATETGEFQQPEWTAKFTSPLQARYVGEDQPNNAVWQGQARDRTYYPDSSEAATAEFGYQITGGRVVSGGEDGTPPEALDTTGVKTKAEWIGSKSERMIYTMDEGGDLRLADPKAEQKEHPGMRVHHSTLAAGEAVAGAGEMKIREGVVEQVSDASGHYRPDFAATQQVAGALKDQGVDTDKVTFELGNYLPGDQRLADTVVSGTELLSYDRESILKDLNPILRKQVQALGKQRWGGAWDWLQPAKRKEEEDEFWETVAAPYAAMSDRELQNEGRALLQGRHDRFNAVLAEIKVAKGWREDPLGRFDWRWYDGENWTARVSKDDKESQDPEGAQQLSPGVAAPSQAPTTGVQVAAAYASSDEALSAAGVAGAFPAQQQPTGDEVATGAYATSNESLGVAAVANAFPPQQAPVGDVGEDGYVTSPAPASQASPAPT